MTNEYAVTEEDLKGGGGGNKAKPRGVYTGQISKAESKLDKNKKVYLGFGIAITHGALKKQLIFENYLTLNPQANAFHKARRNSFYKAIGLEAGAVPYGVPDGPAVELLNGTYINVQLEHRYEQVPNQDYNIVTSKSAKSQWKIDGWDACVNDAGQLFRDPAGNVFDAPVDPKEEVTFYSMADEFEGVGESGENDATDYAATGPSTSSSGSSEDPWG